MTSYNCRCTINEDNSGPQFLNDRRQWSGVGSILKHLFCNLGSLPSRMNIYIYIHWRRKGGGGGGGGRGHVPPTFLIGGEWYVCAPPPPPPTHTHTLLAPHFYFPLELYVYIILTNNYLSFFIYQLFILWTISIN